MMKYKTKKVSGIDVFYRETGKTDAPKLLLLGGFPSSSHQWRNLMPLLSDSFHMISPDYPGFGNTELPDPKKFAYTFDHLSEIVEEFLTLVGFTGPIGWYMQDYGGPIGNRIIGRNPSWLEWQVIQNSNAYEVGFTAAWESLRNAFWKERNEKTESAIKKFLTPEVVKTIYLTGAKNAELISPDNWNMDLFFLRDRERRKRNLTFYMITEKMSNCILYGRNLCANISQKH